MPGTAHITHGLVRHVGKPTSGRFVYKARDTGRWYWQCDLCGAPSQTMTVDTMQAAFTEAIDHAQSCTGHWGDDVPFGPAEREST